MTMGILITETMVMGIEMKIEIEPTMEVET